MTFLTHYNHVWYTDALEYLNCNRAVWTPSHMYDRCLRFRSFGREFVRKGRKSMKLGTLYTYNELHIGKIRKKKAPKIMRFDSLHKYVHLLSK